MLKHKMGTDSNDENSTAKLEMEEESANEGLIYMFYSLLRQIVGKNYYV